jgi:hypothetical protein
MARPGEESGFRATFGRLWEIPLFLAGNAPARLLFAFMGLSFGRELHVFEKSMGPELGLQDRPKLTFA